MIVNIAGTDIDMKKVTHLSPVGEDGHYGVHFEGDKTWVFADVDFSRKKFIQLWKNSQVTAKPVLLVLLPWRHMDRENIKMQIESVTKWVREQVKEDYHIVCFTEAVEKLEISIHSLSDVDDTLISNLQESIEERLEKLAADIKAEREQAARDNFNKDKKEKSKKKGK